LTGVEKPLCKNIFMLGSCTPIIGIDVRCYKSEREMLLAWREFVQAVCLCSMRFRYSVSALGFFFFLSSSLFFSLLLYFLYITDRQIDPDMFTGYNIVNFDFGYLTDRAQKLKLDKFEYLTRMTNQKVFW
jgi:DNA polymerase delta subunit 1